jgi:methylase of polypeptide subunit release factors
MRRFSSMIPVLLACVAVAQTNPSPRLPDLPYLPTTEPAVDAMLKLASVKSSDVVYDLGCGDGRLVIAAAKKYGAHGVGIDINPDRIREANANARKGGLRIWSALRKTIFSKPISMRPPS